MKSDIWRRFANRRLRPHPARQTFSLGTGTMTGVNVAAAHFLLAALLQTGSYGFYLAGEGPTAELSWVQLFLLPAAQLPTLSVAVLLGWFAASARAWRGGPVVVFTVALLCNGLLVLNQRIYAVFFTGFDLDLVDDSAWNDVAERVFARTDPMLFIAIAGLVAATLWTLHSLTRPPVGATAARSPQLDADRRNPLPRLRAGVVGSLGVAVIAAMAMVTMSMETRNLNRHPLASVFYDKARSTHMLEVLAPQAKVYAPRFGSQPREAKSASLTNATAWMKNLGHTQPNLVLAEVEIDAENFLERAQARLDVPSSNHAVIFEHVVPGTDTPEIRIGELLARLGQKGYHTATWAATVEDPGASGNSATDPCTGFAVPASVHTWMQGRGSSDTPLLIRLAVDERAASCAKRGEMFDVSALTASLMDALETGGGERPTLFALLIKAGGRTAHDNLRVQSPISTIHVVLTARGMSGPVVTATSAGTFDDVAATLYHLLGLPSEIGEDLLSERRIPRNFFWVEDGPLPYWGVRDGDWIYQASVLGTEQQLYNLAVDATQRNNLAAIRPRQAALYRSLCATWFAVEGHERLADKAAFVVQPDGWWLPMDRGVPGAKRVDFGVSGDRPVPRQSTLRRFHPYDPVLAQVSLRPFGERRSLAFEWSGPEGSVDTFKFNVESTWHSVRIVPGGGFPMAPGRWRLLVKEQGIPRVAGEFLVDAKVPETVAWAREPRALLEVAAGVEDTVRPESGAPAFHPRERFTSAETPVIQTRWAPGSGVHRLTLRWRAPTGEIYTREYGLREEWEVLRAELDAPAPPWIAGDWEVTVHEGAMLLGTVVVHIDETVP